jgi:NADH dehydrogenase FAD-containing subunit
MPGENQNRMKRLVILGAGTAGTMMANRLRKRMPAGGLTNANQEIAVETGACRPKS